MNKCRGFTLIELLVVIAVSGILTAILIPVFVGVRERGRRTVCASNLKQIGAAFIMYQESWDDLFPAYKRYHVRKSAQQGCDSTCHWSPPLEPYLKNPLLSNEGKETVFLCPSAENNRVNSYAMNLFLGDAGLRPNQERPERLVETTGVYLADVKTSSRTVLVYDTPIPPMPEEGAAFDPDYWGTRWSNWQITRLGDLAEVRKTARPLKLHDVPEYLRPRHHNGNLVSFVDGHVKWLTNMSRYVGANTGNRQSGTEGFRLE